MAVKRERFATYRKAAGFSQEQLAEQLGVERSTVARWEAGDTQPQPWLRPRISRALGVSNDELTALLAPAADVPPREDRLDHAMRHPPSADFVTVALLREQVRDLVERYDREPSTSLLAEAGQRLGQVAFLRGQASTGRVRRELYAVEAESATLMGQLVWDASQRRDHASARAHYDQAIAAARQVGDPAAEGHALLRKSFVALYGQRDPEAGLNLAQRTAHTTRRTSHVLTGLAFLHVAEAHAMLGDATSCERALGGAESRFERIEPDDVAGDLFSPAQFDRLAGSCYLVLGEHRRAQSILERTAGTLRDRKKSHAIVLGNLTLAHIRQEQFDAAAVTLHEALDVLETTRGGGGLNIVFSAGRELRPWRHEPSVQDAYDRLLALMAAA